LSEKGLRHARQVGAGPITNVACQLRGIMACGEYVNAAILGGLLRKAQALSSARASTGLRKQSTQVLSSTVVVELSGPAAAPWTSRAADGLRTGMVCFLLSPMARSPTLLIKKGGVTSC
jgi:hypothetical protein